MILRIITLVLLLCHTSLLHAKINLTVKSKLIREENPDDSGKNRLILPYIFATDSLGTTLGVGGGVKGYGQDQLMFAGTAFASNEEAVGLFLGMWDYQFSFAPRLFFSALGMASHFPKQRAYTSYFSEPGQARPGENSSDSEDYVELPGYDNWTEFKLEYVLPIGSAKQNVIRTNRVKGGLLQSDPLGGKVWNPNTSGVTMLLLKQANRYRTFEVDPERPHDYSLTTHNTQLGVAHINTDFPANPSYGSHQFVGITRDFGKLESDGSWTFWEYEGSKYFTFGKSEYAKQRILALNFWTGDTPTWEEVETSDGRIEVINRPPYFEGASLGGMYRMRGFSTDRFNDRSVIYTTAEYRYTLHWNPIGDIHLLRFLRSDWLQIVPFVEGGRVAGDYSSELLRDWKFDAGVSARGMFSGAVVRLDIAVSSESTNMWVMFGHPF